MAANFAKLPELLRRRNGGPKPPLGAVRANPDQP